jgi:hypothetical protein
MVTTATRPDAAIAVSTGSVRSFVQSAVRAWLTIEPCRSGIRFGRENQIIELQFQSQHVSVVRPLETIRELTIIVPVLMTQVSLKPNKNP